MEVVYQHHVCLVGDAKSVLLEDALFWECWWPSFLDFDVALISSPTLCLCILWVLNSTTARTLDFLLEYPGFLAWRLASFIDLCQSYSIWFVTSLRWENDWKPCANGTQFDIFPVLLDSGSASQLPVSHTVRRGNNWSSAVLYFQSIQDQFIFFSNFLQCYENI